MEDLLRSFGYYIKAAEINSFEFWIYPIGTLVFIWLLTLIGLKILSKGKKLKTVFIIHNFWICNSILIGTIIIGLICYRWSINYFSYRPIQLSLLLSLFIALLIPLISLFSLRRFFTNEDLKEIASQPKTQNQLEETITHSKKIFKKTKLLYLVLLIGFIFLLFSLQKGKNLISIVFDNSGSMERKNAIEALSETFDNLDKNNEIILTTLDGLGENSSGAKSSLNEILGIDDYNKLQGGNVVSFTDPISAKNGLNQITNQCWGSPICESIWKSFLFIKDVKANNSYNNRLLIIITDGDDNIGNTILINKFFFDDETFVSIFPTEKVFLIDYSDGKTNPLLQRFSDSGCESYIVTNNKLDYNEALDSALKSFKNNWYLIYWVIIITVLMSIIALLVEPKKII
jgi:hypothetical protein